MARPRARTAVLLATCALTLGALGACSDADEGSETAGAPGTSLPVVTLPEESGFGHGGGTSAPKGTGVLSPAEEMQEWCDTYPGVALSAEDAVVKFAEDAVCPAYVTVVAGTPVSFKNLTAAPQTVKITDADDAVLAESPSIEPGQSWSHALDEPATYNFYTTALPDLRGAIEVQEAT